LSCTLNLPTVGQSFPAGRFYVDTLAHRNFAGEEGQALAETALRDAGGDLGEVKDALGDVAAEHLGALRLRLARQRYALEEAADADAFRSITEEAFAVRQEASRLRHEPSNRAAVLSHRIKEARVALREAARGEADPRLMQRHAQLLDNADTSVAIGGPGDLGPFEDAERLLDHAEALRYHLLFDRPDYLAAFFRDLARQPHLAVDPKLFAAQVRRGEEARSRPSAGRSCGEPSATCSTTLSTSAATAARSPPPA
jgi:hypothetical protein